MSARVIVTARYTDARGAIAFLEDAFGFEQRLVVDGPGGGVVHAQLTIPGAGDAAGMLMLSDAHGGEYDTFVKPPGAVGGVCTQAAYVIVEDCDAHHDRAKAAGAEILMAPEDQDHGGRLYTCRDVGGHVWNFGTYDPWAGGE